MSVAETLWRYAPGPPPRPGSRERLSAEEERGSHRGALFRIHGLRSAVMVARWSLRVKLRQEAVDLRFTRSETLSLHQRACTRLPK